MVDSLCLTGFQVPGFREKLIGKNPGACHSRSSNPSRPKGCGDREVRQDPYREAQLLSSSHLELLMFPFETRSDVHSSDWAAGEWAAAITALVLAGLLGCLAVALGRLSYWLFYDAPSGSYRSSVVAAVAAAALWMLSLWPFTTAMAGLLRHSRSIQFGLLFSFLGTFIIAVSYFIAMKGADRFARWNFNHVYLPNPPVYLHLVATIPCGVTALTALWIHAAERVHREGALSIVLEALFGLAIGIGIFVLLIKLARALHGMQSQRF
ncbi:hypothetical protein [Rhodococcoides fascians]|uniref:hypothetical protein n=1 Tax=Rhodococcoides fascians TaxID=1828 RepID=UPI0012D2A670|nr:hypothetical protein [Rhodococcus fascians]